MKTGVQYELSGNGILLPTQWGRTECYLQPFNPPNQQI